MVLKDLKLEILLKMSQFSWKSKQTADKKNYQTGYEALNLIIGFLRFFCHKSGDFHIQNPQRSLGNFGHFTLFHLPKP